MDILPERVLIQHPTWCSASHDLPTDSWTDPEHLSLPEPLLHLSQDDWQIQGRLSRTDTLPVAEVTQHSGKPGVELVLTSLSAVVEVYGVQRPLRANPFLTPADARRVAALLVHLADAAEANTVEVSR